MVFIAIFQSVLFLGHIFLYETWTYFWKAPNPPGISPLQLTLGILSVSFLVTSLLAFRYTNPLLRWLYTVAAIWLGAASFLFFAACACWGIFGAVRLAGLNLNGRLLDVAVFGTAAAISAYGVINAAWTRVRRVSIKLPNLPASWRGRTAALISDMHLGHVKNTRFARRMTAMINKLKPDVVWIAGDLYDGTAVDAKRAASPLKDLRPPLGRSWVCPTVTPRTRGISVRCWRRSESIKIGRACCSHTRPITSPWPRLRESGCKSPGIPIWDSSFRTRGSLPASIRNLCTG